MPFSINPWLNSRLSRRRLRPYSAVVTATVLLALAGAGGLAASAQAETYTVGTTEDLAGTCEFPALGNCSLRQLITREDNLPSTPNPPDTIVVPAGTYFFANGNPALTIYRSVNIAGAGARTTFIEQSFSNSDRVFRVEPNPRNQVVPSVVISGLAILFGRATANNEFFGGDILNEATLTLSEDAINSGTAESGSGGGISNRGGTLTVTRSLVSGNESTNAGAGGDAGGIQNFGPNPVTHTAGKLVIENSTIANNTAALGGGIFSWCGGEGCSTDGSGASNTTTIVDSTIAGNNGGTRSNEGGGLLVGQGTISIENSIVADNAVNNPAPETPSDCGKNGISSLGHNLESGADCGFTSTGDLQNTKPKFTTERPEANGGNTDTLGLEPTSPGIDAIPANNPFCAGVSDQRGVARPQGAGCDIGAFEMSQPQAVEGAQFSGQVATSPGCGIITPPLPTIEWGDGQTSQGTVDKAGINGSHTYAEEGTYIGSATFQNDCGEHKVAFQVDVTDAPLTATGVSVSATAGVQLSATVATFTDADPAGTAKDYTATINWGDGNTSPGTIAPAAGGGFAVTGSHTYAAGGTYATSVAISDTGGASATATSSANVAPAPLPPPAPPTLVTTAPPSVLTTTSAVFTATVNPNGLPTTVHFEYGGTFGGVTVAAITYGTSTPNQSGPADFANHTVTATVTGLLPNVTYHVRAVATNSLGTAQGADQILTTPADPPPPPPVLGKTANVAPVSGIVYIELPPGATLASASLLRSAPPTQAFAALTKGRAFIPLTEARQIPMGSILDTTRGVAGITTANIASARNKLQFGDFGAGIFKMLQHRRQRGLTELDIIDNHSARQICATRGKGADARIAARRPSSKVLGRLTVNSHGHFSAHGQYSAATVRGTTWAVANRCDGTLTRVVRGVLSVRDFRLRKTVTLFTGQSYLAKAHP